MPPAVPDDDEEFDPYADIPDGVDISSTAGKDATAADNAGEVKIEAKPEEKKDLVGTASSTTTSKIPDFDYDSPEDLIDHRGPGQLCGVQRAQRATHVSGVGLGLSWSSQILLDTALFSQRQAPLLQHRGLLLIHRLIGNFHRFAPLPHTFQPAGQPPRYQVQGTVLAAAQERQLGADEQNISQPRADYRPLSPTRRQKAPLAYDHSFYLFSRSRSHCPGLSALLAHQGRHPLQPRAYIAHHNGAALFRSSYLAFGNAHHAVKPAWALNLFAKV